MTFDSYSACSKTFSSFVDCECGDILNFICMEFRSIIRWCFWSFLGVKIMWHAFLNWFVKNIVILGCHSLTVLIKCYEFMNKVSSMVGSFRQHSSQLTKINILLKTIKVEVTHSKDIDLHLLNLISMTTSFWSLKCR